MRGGVVEHALPIEDGERVSDHQDPVWDVIVHHLERQAEIVGFAYSERLQGDAKLLAHRLRRAISQGHSKVVSIPEDSNLPEIGSELLEQFETLGRDLR